jgi:uncharacterized protein (DUF362 family)
MTGMASKLSRREAVKRVALSGAVVSVAAVLTRVCYDRGLPGAVGPAAERQVRDFRVRAQAGGPVMAIARSSTDPATLTRLAIDGLGGMQRFVSQGDVVALKPNIGWDRLPVHAANTNPQVVAEVVRLAFEAGAKRVVVTDASCNEPSRSFQRSGIWRAAHEQGATVILPAGHRFREMRLRGDLLDLWPIYTPIIDADKVVNLPIAKHHGLCKLTAAMKNWYGLLGGRRNQLHQRIDVSIADLATFMRPTLTVLDATRVLVRNGPQGGNLDDTKETHQVVASLDQVAVDAYAATLIGQKPEDIGYLRIGQERGLGSVEWEQLPRVEV